MTVVAKPTAPPTMASYGRVGVSAMLATNGVTRSNSGLGVFNVV